MDRRVASLRVKRDDGATRRVEVSIGRQCGPAVVRGEVGLGEGLDDELADDACRRPGPWSAATASP